MESYSRKKLSGMLNDAITKWRDECGVFNWAELYDPDWVKEESRKLRDTVLADLGADPSPGTG